LNIFYRLSLNLYLRLLIIFNLSLHIKMSVLKIYQIFKLMRMKEYNTWVINCFNAFRLKDIWKTISEKKAILTFSIEVIHVTLKQKTVYTTLYEAHLIKLIMWTKNNYRVKALLMLSINENLRTYILSMKKASDMWIKLKELYSESFYLIIIFVIKEMRRIY